MKRLLLTLSFVICHLSFTLAQTEVTTQEAKNLYKNTTKKRVSVHDPSVVYEPISKRYYIFGSHKAGAYTTDLQNWTWAAPTWSPNDNSQAFTTPAVKKVKKGGVEVDMPQFNAMAWSAKGSENYNIDGNMWAPDVIWNPIMEKWCMYLSINGDKWYSSILLLTSNSITGPYKYQAPVVISGFYNGTDYKDTDLELVIGTQPSLPSRYNCYWGTRYPNNIDPCVFYDEEGHLRLVYGSWSGGIWTLELDEETGLRDYDVTYTQVGSGDGITVDPYFGKKLAGGYYASGEAPYIEYINGYYYLFVTNGGLAAGGDPDDINNGGYQMRVFRSTNPDGPFKDAFGHAAVLSKYEMNFGSTSNTVGENIFGAYGEWGFTAQGDNSERSQGHNSIIAAEDGRIYLVYHTRFQNRGEAFETRVHQVFQNKAGWLVAAPFEYNGETTTSDDVATTQLVPTEDIPGTYQLLVHRYKLDHRKKDLVTPVEITLSADGTVSGTFSGTWSVEEGTSYLTLKLGGTTYDGVIMEEQMDGKSTHAIAFTATTKNGVNVWGYKLHPKYAVAWQLNNQKVPVTNNQDYKKNVDLYSLDQNVDNVEVSWTSSEPNIISAYGQYNPTGLQENTPVTLTARVQSNSYYWTQDYQVNALSESNSQPTADWKSGLLAHYGFDDETLSNTLNTSEQAQLKRNGTTAIPATEDGAPLRNGQVMHLNFGANGKESYVAIPNPLYGKTLDTGATISFWVKRSDDNLWDALLGMTNGASRLFVTGNAYVGFNNGAGSWFDINNPNTTETKYLATGQWQLVTITIQRTATTYTGGVTIYVNGSKKSSDRYNGEIDGVAKTTKTAFDYNLIVDLLTACPELYLGYGSFWGSPDARFDDVMVYDRVLSLSEISALEQMVNRVTDYTNLTDGIQTVVYEPSTNDHAVYDLQGRRVTTPTKGLFIRNGKKFFVK